MNPLELTQAAAESSGRTLADMSPVYAELVNIAEQSTSEQFDTPEGVRKSEAETALLIELSKMQGQAYVRAEAEIVKMDAGWDQSRALADMVASIATIGETGKAMDIMSAIPVEGTRAEVLASLIGVIAGEGRIQFAQALMPDINHMLYPHDWNKAYASIGVAIAKTGDIDRALSTVEELQLDYIKLSVVADIAKTTAEQGKLDKAIEIAASLKDGYPKDIALAAIVVGYATAGDMNRAIEIMGDMQGETDYTIALYRILWSDETPIHPEAALQLLPNFTQDNQRQVAHQIIAELAATSKDLGPEAALAVIQGLEYCPPRVKALGLISSVMVEQGNTDGALELISTEAQSESDKHQMLLSIVLALVQVGDMPRAQDILDACQDVTQKSNALCSIALMLAEEKGDIDQALTVADQIPDGYFYNNTLSGIAVAATNSSDPNRAWAIISQIKLPRGRAEAYIELAMAIHKKLSEGAEDDDGNVPVNTPERSHTI